MTTPPEPLDPNLERWRLILGEAGDACRNGHALRQDAAGRDSALDWLYGRDEDLARRDVRTRTGGDGPSQLTTVDWLNQITKLFPKETIERLERDAVERYNIPDVLTDPDVLGRIEPNPTLLGAVLRTKHLMNPEVLALARRIVAAVVRELMDRLEVTVRQSFTGTRSRRPSRFRQARNFDVRRTIRANLGHYQPEQRRLLIEEAYFFGRTRRQLQPWQFILLVDQSGSMVSSVIHSAVTAACLWGLPGIRTHLVAFDTDVVDLTSDVDDPVELLLKVQLGGGTDIARAVTYGASLIDNPRRTIVAVVTDFYEGASPSALVHAVRRLVEQGSHVLGLAALDEEANPSYDRQTAQLLADVGAHVGAMTPAHLAEFIAETVSR
ncbi:VWA domain-containing protein [Rugosimonospora acidiphila]|uniref:VWA domain-containing protein n=1 Tax=Rugosimonospora acidiphila TaxID=556531 RepID=A0ABP9SFP6_9ACTN